MSIQAVGLTMVVNYVCILCVSVVVVASTLCHLYVLCCVRCCLVPRALLGVPGQMSSPAVGGLRRHHSNEHLFGSVSTRDCLLWCVGLHVGRGGWRQEGRGGGGRRGVEVGGEGWRCKRGVGYRR